MTLAHAVPAVSSTEISGSIASSTAAPSSEGWDLIARNRERIKKLCVKMAYGPISAEDLFSCALIELAEHVCEYQPERASFITWAYQRVRLSRLRLKREARKHDRAPYGSVSFDGGEADEDIPVVQLQTPEGAAGHAERVEATVDVARALERGSAYSRSAVLITLQGLDPSIHPARPGTRKRRSYSREIERDLRLLLDGSEERALAEQLRAAEASDSPQLALL